jgi:hypothetical protein
MCCVCVLLPNSDDSYYNFNTQLYGRKRFLLFPPSNITAAYIYPFLHPSHAQSTFLVSFDRSMFWVVFSSLLIVLSHFVVLCV